MNAPSVNDRPASLVSQAMTTQMPGYRKEEELAAALLCHPEKQPGDNPVPKNDDHKNDQGYFCYLVRHCGEVQAAPVPARSGSTSIIGIMARSWKIRIPRSVLP